jgi:hypothetical protein
MANPPPSAVRDGNASEHDAPIRLDNDSRTECNGTDLGVALPSPLNGI